MEYNLYLLNPVTIVLALVIVFASTLFNALAPIPIKLPTAFGSEPVRFAIPLLAFGSAATAFAAFAPTSAKFLSVDVSADRIAFASPDNKAFFKFGSLQHYPPGTQENYNSFLSRDLVMGKGKELEFPEGPGRGLESAKRILMKGF